ncbi:uncharacterized protein LOC144663070 [Oculina patagonica]
MSQPRRFHLFNCDNIYELSIAENLLKASKAKLGFEFSVEKHSFTLSEMSELSTNVIPKMQMDFAMFVVHAHESRLLINNDNLEYGYAKVYRALLQATGNLIERSVIVVIGGDGNYKNETEEEKSVISRWAWRKIAHSQFKEEFIDGRKSFVFSWNKKHRAIHEEALLHFFDPNKTGLKFEYQPKPEGEGSKSAQSLQKGQSVDEERRGESLFSPSNKTEQKRDDSLFSPFNSAEQRREDKFPQQSSLGYDSPQDHATSSSHNTGVLPPLQSHADVPQKREGQMYPKLSHTSSVTKGKQNLNSKQVGRRTEQVTRPLHALSIKNKKDLAVLGWEAKPESMLEVVNLIQRYRKELNLAEEPEVRNSRRVTDLQSYLENNPLKSCVLLVDAKQVRAAIKSSSEPDADYWRLLETAERNVAAKVIIIVCCQSSLSREEEEVINCTIKSKFKEEDKVFVTSIKDGKMALEPKEFLKLMMLTIPNTNPDPQERSAAPIPHSAVTITGELVLLRSLLRNGKISYQLEDIQLWDPEFIVPDDIAHDLYYKHFYIPVTGVRIVLEHNGNLQCSIDPKLIEVSRSRNEGIQIATNEILQLKTRIHNGVVSFQESDVDFRYGSFHIPRQIIDGLKDEYWSTPCGELYIIADEKWNLRCIVKIGRIMQLRTFAKKYGL